MADSTLAFVFPGQGSQALGMLAALAGKYPVIHSTFAEASEGAEVDLWELAQQGPEVRLNQTEFTQPVLLAAGVAVWRAWAKAGGAQPALLAGHSLGEYTALVAAGTLSLREGAWLVRERGRLMQAAVPEGEGAMAAVLGADEAALEAVCAEAAQGEVVAPANYNAPGQIVIAGDKTAVERAAALLAVRGIRKVIRLPVSVPSHTTKMAKAAERLGEAMTRVAWQPPNTPIVQNVDAQPHDKLEEIRHALILQLAAPVRWTACMARLTAAGIKRVGECGPGKVLTGLMKRIDSMVDVQALGTPDEFDLALKNWSLNQ